MLTRRDLLVGSAAMAAGASVSAPFLLPNYQGDQRPRRSRVAILHAERYYHELDQILAAGLRLFPINVRDKTVVLKPNLVDDTPADAINTHPMLVLAAAESFRCLGARYVIVAEGPGHQRDTQLVLSQSGYQQYLRDEKIRFVDLNRDELVRTPLRSRYMEIRPLAPPHCAGDRLPGFHAQNQDSPLGRRHPQHEEHVRHCAWCKVRMAEEHPPLERHSGEHHRSVRNRSSPLRDRRRHRSDGRQRASQWQRSSSGKDRARG